VRHVIEVASVGGPEVLRYGQQADLIPGPGQILVATEAIGVNFIDIYRREGRYPFPMPGIPGEEGAGRVLAVGLEAIGFAPGDRVAWTTVLGSYASQVLVPAEKAIHIPEGIDMKTAAAALVQGMTAHFLVRSSYAVKKGDTLLVHAAAGGVGLLLVQMIKTLGGRVIGTVSTEAKEKVARENGADEIIRSDATDDLAARVRELTHGTGANAAYDGVGAKTFAASLASLRTRGTLVLFGSASGPVPPLDVMQLAWGGSLTLTRPYLEHFRATREEFLWRATDVFQGVLERNIKIRIGGTFPLARADEAQRALSSRQTMGKLLLIP
jgi:NADPH2:quinone reductase